MNNSITSALSNQVTASIIYSILIKLNKHHLAGNQEVYPMLETKDFATGCLTIILCVILIPLFFLVFKLTLVCAIPLAILIAIILGITFIGRIVRYFITGK
jgi:hypothetical protein